jgi:hypothetical protein
MKILSELAGETIFIHQTSIWKKIYEIKYGDELLGTIRKKKVFSSGLIVKIFNVEWEIYRPNFWLSEIAIREKGKENPIAKFKRKILSRDGFVFLPKGQKLRLQFGVFSSGKYGVYNLSGNCLVRLRDKFSFIKNTDVEIEEASDLLDEFPWVIILAWYISHLRKRSAAAG